MIELNGFDLNSLGAKYNEWLAAQPPAVDALLTGLTSALQGAAIGYLIGSFAPPVPPEGASPQLSAQLNMLQSGGPWVQARNLAVLTGVNAALSKAIKIARKGKEDVYSS